MMQCKPITQHQFWPFTSTVLFPLTGLALAYWLVAQPIIGSPYWGDDIGDSQLPMRLAVDHESLWTFIVAQTREWSATTGRFFPVNIAHASVVYYLFDTRASYKLYQFAILAVTLVSFGMLMGVMLKSRWAAYVGFGFALMTLQFKNWFDPYWQFSGQQGLSGILACTALTLALVATRLRRGRATIVVAALGMLAFAAAGMTYESSMFFFVAVVLLLIRERASRLRRMVIALAYVGTTMVLFLNLLWQRSNAVVNNPAYTVSLEPHPVLLTLKNQMVNAIPLTYRHYTLGSLLPADPSWPASKITTIVLVLIFIAVMTMALVQLLRIPRAGLRWSALAAMVFWVVPSFFVAISARWQTEVRPGVGYIPVLAGGLAVAWLLVLGASAIGRLLARPDGIGIPWNRWPIPTITVATGMAILAAFVVSVTAVSNVSAVRENPAVTILQLRRDTYAQAVSHGLFNGLPADAVLIRPVFEWWDWRNTAFSAWYGASPSLQFITPEMANSEYCGTTGTCFTLVEENPRAGVITYKVVPY